MIFPLLMFFTLDLKKRCPDDRSHTSLVPVTHQCLMVALATEVLGVEGTPHGTTSGEMVGASPRLGGGAENLLQDLVVHGVSADAFGSVAPSDVAPALWSSGAMSPGVSGPYQPGSPGSLSPPINRRRVEDEEESACS
jgi:hypothetical protein